MNISWMLEFIQKINKAYASCCEPICREFEISRTSFDILLFLSNHPRFYTARDVSKYRNLKSNVVSVHVDQLVNDGYLLREPVAEDRRKVKLICTSHAEPIIQKGQQMQKRLYMQLTCGISGEEMDAFRQCFKSIMENAENLPNEKGIEGVC